jgi:hypothetical protein
MKIQLLVGLAVFARAKIFGSFEGQDDGAGIVSCPPGTELHAIPTATNPDVKHCHNCAAGKFDARSFDATAGCVECEAGKWTNGQTGSTACADSPVASHDQLRHDEQCAAGAKIDCSVDSSWSIAPDYGWSECSEPCGQGTATRTRKIIFNACNGGGPCAPTKQTEECMKRVCDCEKVACKYVTGHTCMAYGDANDNTYSTHGELQDYLQAGNFGTAFIQNDHKHDSTACDPSTSLRVFHHRERATTGHHCKLKSGAGSDCHCKCNALFQGAYNPKTNDLYDHTIDAPATYGKSFSVTTVEFELDLDGVSASEFADPAVALALQQAIADEYGVDASQVEIEAILDDDGGGYGRGVCRFRIRIRRLAGRLYRLVVALMKKVQAELAKQKALAEAINALIPADKNITVDVADQTTPVITTADPKPPTAHPTSWPTAYPTPFPTPYPTPACVPGRYMVSSQHGICQHCLHGSVSTTYNAVACTVCPNGNYAVAPASECTNCAPGQFHATSGEACTDCQAGRFAEGVATLECLHCPSGKFQNGVDYTSCDDCSASQWTEGQSGAMACVDKPVDCDGTYFDTKVDDECGTCDGPGKTGCDSMCFSTKTNDECGTCDGPGKTGCDSMCFSTKAHDVCGVCGGPGKTGCDSTCFSTKVHDVCGVCGGPGKTGCDSTCFSTKSNDICGVCGGPGKTGCESTCFSTKVDAGCGCGVTCPVDPPTCPTWLNINSALTSCTSTPCANSGDCLQSANGNYRVYIQVINRRHSAEDATALPICLN